MSAPGNTFDDSYTLDEELGEGSFAVVWKGIHKITNKTVAIKIFEQVNLESEEQKVRFWKEVNLLKKIEHPFIVKLFDIIETSEKIYYIMEYCGDTTLTDVLENHRKLAEPIALRYFVQLISVLDYLHNVKHICHRDLNTDNIMIDSNNNIKVIDLGLSNCFSDTNPFLKTACGSPAFAAPEMINGQKYTKSADLWSAGVLLYTMTLGMLPFRGNNIGEVVRKIVMTKPRYPSCAESQAIDLIQRLLIKDPKSRADETSIKQHPWIKDSVFSELAEKEFWNDPLWCIEFVMEDNAPLDESVISILLDKGIDRDLLISDLREHKYNHITASYRIERSEAIDQLSTKFVNEIASRFVSTEVPRPVRSFRPQRSTFGI